MARFTDPAVDTVAEAWKRAQDVETSVNALMVAPMVRPRPTVRHAKPTDRVSRLPEQELELEKVCYPANVVAQKQYAQYEWEGPDAVPKQRGVCPACGDALVEHQAGGAYRSIARTERRCATCESVVLSLHDAPGVVGKFSDRSAHDWVHVTVASRCPQCLESMTRATYVSDRGQVEVERCERCALVVLEPEDERRLRGK